MDFSLSGKHAIVCGSTRGIGRATAHAFAAHGASVTMIARSLDALQDEAATLPREHGQTHHVIAADFHDPDTLRGRVTQFIEAHAPAHILVNNTGGPPAGPAYEAETAAFEHAFRAHLVCNHILVQAVVPGMEREGYGRIINIISTSVKQPIRGLGVSNTVRAAVASWAKTLSIELAPHGITVNNILPGATETQRLESIIARRATETGRSRDAVRDEMLEEIPAGRFGLPEDIAATALFLASPAAGYINGVNLAVDGGRTIAL